MLPFEFVTFRGNISPEAGKMALESYVKWAVFRIRLNNANPDKDTLPAELKQPGRKSHNLFNIRGIAEQHDQAVHAQGNAGSRGHRGKVG